jgi:hypothetical protein
MIRMSDPNFKSTGGDRADDLAIEREHLQPVSTDK